MLYPPRGWQGRRILGMKGRRSLGTAGATTAPPEGCGELGLGRVRHMRKPSVCPGKTSAKGQAAAAHVWEGDQQPAVSPPEPELAGDREAGAACRAGAQRGDAGTPG